MKVVAVKYVYLVRAGADQYKVGIASNVGNRLRALQTSNGHAIELVSARRAVAAADLEKQLHQSLAEQSSAGGSEWFKLTSQQAINLAIKLNALPTMESSEVERLQDAIEDVNANQDIIYKMMEEIVYRLHDDTPTRGRKAIERPARKSREDADEELYEAAVEIVIRAGAASASMLQRRMRIGYARAARLLDELEEKGVIGPADGARARTVLAVRLPQPTKLAI